LKNKENSIYTCAADKVRELKERNELEIMKSDIVDFVNQNSNVHEIEREKLESIAVNLLVTIALSQNNCYSIVRGSGRFINVDLCDQIETLDGIESNLRGDVQAKLAAIRKINDIRAGVKVLDGQLDFEDIGVGCG